MDYKLKEVNGKYVVEEKQTGLIVFNANKEQDAKKMMKHLNLGGGFSGFTPNFFLNTSNKNNQESYKLF